MLTVRKEVVLECSPISEKNETMAIETGWDEEEQWKIEYEALTPEERKIVDALAFGIQLFAARGRLLRITPEVQDNDEPSEASPENKPPIHQKSSEIATENTTNGINQEPA